MALTREELLQRMKEVVDAISRLDVRTKAMLSACKSGDNVDEAKLSENLMISWIECRDLTTLLHKVSDDFGQI